MPTGINLDLKIEGNIAGYLTLPKQIDFALASSVTKTLKACQVATVDSLFGQFTMRGGWWKQSSVYGIRVEPMRASDLTNRREADASLYTDAWWLVDHETGNTREPLTSDHLSSPAMRAGKSPIRDAGSKQKLIAAIRARNVGGTKGWSVYKVDAAGGNEMLFARVKRGGRFPKSKLAPDTTRRDSFLIYFNRNNLRFRKVPVLLLPAMRTFDKVFAFTFNAQLGTAITSAK